MQGSASDPLLVSLGRRLERGQVIAGHCARAAHLRLLGNGNGNGKNGNVASLLPQTEP